MTRPRQEMDLPRMGTGWFCAGPFGWAGIGTDTNGNSGAGPRPGATVALDACEAGAFGDDASRGREYEARMECGFDGDGGTREGSEWDEYYSKEVRRGKRVAVVEYGHPTVCVAMSELLLRGARAEGHRVSVLPGVSCLGALWAACAAVGAMRLARGKTE